MTKIPKPKNAAAELLKLHMRAGRISFIEEHQFHPTRKWKFDFVIREPMASTFFLDYDSHSLAVEIDGGNHMVRKTKDGKHVAVGRHTKDADYTKLCEAAILGWRVLRFSPAMVKSGYAIDAIKRAIK